MAATSFTLSKTLPLSSIRTSASLRSSEASGLRTNLPVFRIQRTEAFSAKTTRLVVRAQETDTKGATLSGVIFQPFQEVKGEIAKIPKTSDESFARQRFSDACEAAINEQINIEYNISYVYHAMYAYFNRDNVGLPGFAKYFKAASDEEREHAEALMDYQNKRGGRVKLGSILMPTMEFDHAEKGEALYAMELALSLEKLNNEKLLALHKVADDNNDVQMAEYIESHFLGDQVNAIEKISQFVAQLRRVGKGHGVYHFDLELGRATA